MASGVRIMEFKPPTELLLTGDLPENWENFKQSFELFITANEFESKPEKVKVAMLLNCIGSEALKVYNTFKDGMQKETLQAVLEKFEEYCLPRKNTIFSRYKFFKRAQEEGETIESFVTNLKSLASKCDFGDQRESLIRDVLILGLRDCSMQERLLRETDLSLHKTIQMCRVSEESRKEVDVMRGSAVEVITKKSSNENLTSKRKFNCFKCGKLHGLNECPAFGKKCRLCGLPNHFEVKCKKKKKFVQELSDSCDEQMLETLVIDSLNSDSVNEAWYHGVILNDKVEVRLKIDSGADVNVLPYSVFKQVEKDVKLKNDSRKISAFGGHPINPMGVAKINCKPIGRDQHSIEFIVVKGEVTPILGRESSVEFNLIRRVMEIEHSSDEKNLIEMKSPTPGISQPDTMFLKKYEKVFTGLGKLPFEYTIKLKKDAVPVVKPVRRIPEILKPRLKDALCMLEKSDIISKVTEPTEWVNDLIIVEKPNGSLRLCLCPLELNKYIMREHYSIPTVDELTANLSGMKYFTVLDMKDGFHQISLNNESSLLCTFNTPFGRYKFNRLPFGLCSSPEIFQRENMKIFGDIKGVQIYFDDIIVATKTEEEHDVVLKLVMERAIKYGVKFNQNKLQYKVHEVSYLGFIFSKSGFRPDGGQVSAILNIKEPNNKKELQKFLGVVTFLHKFIPNMSKLAAPLRNLLKKNVSWSWESEQQNSFDSLKNAISNAPTLGYFDPSKNIIIQTDASKDGIGACLTQEGRPLAYVSRSLTLAEQNYSTVEKELLSICFAVSKFHQFVYGHEFKVQSDHKPLVTIVGKEIHKCTNRIQRMLLKLLKYKFNVEYVPGRFMFVADFLSRNYLNEKSCDDSDMMDVVHTIKIEDYLPISRLKIEMFKKESAVDPVLSKIINYVETGWQDYIKSDSDCHQYFKLKDKLFVKDQILFFEDKVVVPKSMQTEMLKQIHGSAHLGIEKCKKRARGLLYWPKMNSMIELYVGKCKTCEKYCPAKQKEPLISHDIPQLPFFKLGMDFAEYAGKCYLITVDYYSKWFDVMEMPNKSIEAVIVNLLKLCSVHGIPSQIVCDNSPFNSKKLRDFCKEQGIDLIHSSPYYPKSNGMAEKAVGIAKKILKKCNSQYELYEALLEYRVSPVAGTDYSPSEMLMGRLLRSKLPALKSKLVQKVVTKEAHKQLAKRRELTQQYYNLGASKKSVTFDKGTNVIVRDPRKRVWESGVIIDKLNRPRSYKIKTADGKLIERNTIHLRPSKNKYKNIVNYDYEPSVVEEQEQPSSSSTEVVDNNGPTPSESGAGLLGNDGVTKTRYGRAIIKPAWLNDYET